NMPWDGTHLWTAGFNQDGSLGTPFLVAGGVEESIFQPEWSPAGTLYFVSDRSNWWNLYRWQNGRVEPVAPMDAEFAKPQWALAQATYGFQSESSIIASYIQGGSWHLARIEINPESTPGRLEPVVIPSSEMGRGGFAVDSKKVVIGAGSPSETYSIIKLDLSSDNIHVLRRSTGIEVDAGCISLPQPLEFPTENGLSAHAFYYPPKNDAYSAPASERPPLLVKSHGGPTGAAGAALDLSIQYWTSRGFAVMDVNYGGSTGYGREYRQRLHGQWGIVDVDDCVNAARYLVERGLVDGGRLAIDGGSAGGFTTLAVLTFRDVFHAGASHYGVSDLEALAKDTHKFESRYLDSLIGPYPERRDLYLERSPIHHTGGLSCPLILFQGLEDKIVPPDQAESMYQAVKAKGIATAYLAFEGEQHGFRQAANIKRALDAELYFYSQVFGFTLADPVEPVAIDNL
ncbi:MAG: S9 family peptidase, partial [Chloroflexi bacterium]|nr:S9 family peptidase [Chloroflexota bacterium]